MSDLTPKQLVEWKADADIASDTTLAMTARDAIPALIAEVTRLREEREALRQGHDSERRMRKAVERELQELRDGITALAEWVVRQQFGVIDGLPVIPTRLVGERIDALLNPTERNPTWCSKHDAPLGLCPSTSCVSEGYATTPPHQEE